MLMDLDKLFARRAIKPKGICHLGSSFGQEAGIYQKHCPNSPIIWVEALPSVYLMLAESVKKYPNHIPLNACVGDEDGKEVTFHIANNAGMSSSYLELGSHAVEHPDVKFVGDLKMKTVRMDTLMKAHGIEIPFGSFINCDVQGADLLALKGCGDLLNRFDYAYVEINEKPLYVGCALAHEIDEYLAKFGFFTVETKMTKHGWGDRLYATRRKK